MDAEERHFKKQQDQNIAVDFHYGGRLSTGGVELLPSLCSVQDLDFPAFPAGVAVVRSKQLQHKGLHIRYVDKK